MQPSAIPSTAAIRMAAFNRFNDMGRFYGIGIERGCRSAPYGAGQESKSLTKILFFDKELAC